MKIDMEVVSPLFQRSARAGMIGLCVLTVSHVEVSVKFPCLESVHLGISTLPVKIGVCRIVSTTYWGMPD